MRWKDLGVRGADKCACCVAQHPLGSPTHTRRKDRMSYSHEEFIIDLTQVTSTMSPNAPVRFFFFMFV